MATGSLPLASDMWWQLRSFRNFVFPKVKALASLGKTVLSPRQLDWRRTTVIRSSRQITDFIAHNIKVVVNWIRAGPLEAAGLPAKLHEVAWLELESCIAKNANPYQFSCKLTWQGFEQAFETLWREYRKCHENLSAKRTSKRLGRFHDLKYEIICLMWWPTG